MSDLYKAAQQALEALESLQGGCTDSNDGTVEAITVWCPEVIEPLRAALAQPAVSGEPVAWKLWDEDPEGGGDWRYYDAKDFKNGINPTEYFDGLVPLYTTPPKPVRDTKRTVTYVCPVCAASLERQE